jgi:uncharacterized protein YqgC (DUF456 family)
MEIAQSVLLAVTIVMMIGTLLVSIIPFIAGPLIMWVLVLIYAVLSNAYPLTIFIAQTGLMIAGTTTEYWLPLVGVRIEGMSCLGAIGSLVGGIVGTLIIPIPILGTIIGIIIGAMLIEHARIRQWQRTFQAGRAAFKLYLWGVAIEFGFSLVILLVFVGTMIATR